MTALVHRAICGESKRAHSLLASSISDAAATRFLPTVTDLPLDQPAELVWEPFIRGFAHGEFYVVTKTFPDKTATRTGMVKTYVLLLDLEDAGEIDDFASLLTLFPAESDENWLVSTTHEDLLPLGEPLSSEPQGFSALIHALVKGTQQRPIIWLGQNDYEGVIVPLWRALWPAARRQLTLGFHFLPRGMASNSLEVIAVPKALINRWNGYVVVSYDSPVPDDTPMAEAFLRGLPQGEPIRRLLRDLETELNTFADLRKTEICASIIEHLPTATAGELRSLLQFLVQLAPKPDQGKHLKVEVVRRVIESSILGSADDALGLRSLYGLALYDAEKKANEAVAQWIQSGLLDESRADETREVLTEALRQPQSAWSTSVLDSVRYHFVQWRTPLALTLWAWWQAAPALVPQVEALLPKTASVQASLTANCPREITDPLSQSLRDFALRHRWYTLHAAVCASTFSPAEAFATHLAADHRPTESEAITFLASRLPANFTVGAALVSGDDRVMNAAAKLCAANPELLRPYRVEDRAWRGLLAEALALSPGLWASVDQGRSLVDTLMDVIVMKGGLENNLLECLSRTPEADLTANPHRRSIWSLLPAKARSGFLETTANGWITQFQVNPGFERALEPELSAEVFSASGAAKLLNVELPNAPAVGLSVYTHFQQLGENTFVKWLKGLANAQNRVSNAIATQLGELVFTRQWRHAADTLADLSAIHLDFESSARGCLDLLGPVKRFFARRRLKRESVNPTEFWQAFEDVAVQLYRRGPTDMALWSRAGGKDSNLPLEKTPVTQWAEAIHLLRHGGGGKDLSLKSVLATMRGDFHQNRQVLELEQSAREMQT